MQAHVDNQRLDSIDSEFVKEVQRTNFSKNEFQFEYDDWDYPSRIMYKKKTYIPNPKKFISTKAGFLQFYQSDNDSLAIKFITT